MLDLNKNDKDDSGTPFSVVQEKERKVISDHRREASVEINGDLPELDFSNHHSGAKDDIKVASKDQVGLAFSGGGIRSAAFNLGVLQALARKKTDQAQKVPLLFHVDYLSTVSGGGYIGSWFSTLQHRLGGSLQKVVQILEDNRSDPHLAGNPQMGMDKPVGWLRRYSSYLTPDRALLSPDMLSLVITFIRNALLNIVQITALLVLVLMLAAGFFQFGKGIKISSDWLPYVSALQFFGLGFLINMAIKIVNDQLYKKSVSGVYLQFGMPLISAFVWFYACFILRIVDSLSGGITERIGYVLLHTVSGTLGVFVSSCYLYYTLKARSPEFASRFKEVSPFRSDAMTALIFFALCAGCALLGIMSCPEKLHAPFVFRHAMVLMWLSMWISFFIAFCGWIYTSFTHEWWSRFSAWLIIVSSVFYLLYFMVYGLPEIIYKVWVWLTYPSSTAVATVSGAVAIVAKGVHLAFGDKNPSRSLGKWIVKAAPVVLIGLFLCISSLLVHYILVEDFAKEMTNVGAVKLATSCLAVFIVVVLFAWRSDINLFSLHMMYRNRLMRCFLGASHDAELIVESPVQKKSNREAEPDTDFDPNDGIWLTRLGQQRPYHLINTAVNFSRTGKVVDEKAYEWQDRHSHSFLFSGQYCGFLNHYQRTDSYLCGNERSSDPKLSLGLAMTISGAAASPNMGYNTRPSLAVIMSIFNVRLGWWLQNPYGQWNSKGLFIGFYYLLKELFAKASLDDKFVNLSDGGHFENLGVYELLRRKCKLIIVSDAGCDPTHALDDLGRLFHLARVDFGVEIELKGLSDFDLVLSEDGVSPWSDRFCEKSSVLGVIHYSDTEKGVLMYLKSSLSKEIQADLPADVVNYAKLNSSFPHQTTADQFFDSQQFEVYRQLGYLIASNAFSKYC